MLFLDPSGKTDDKNATLGSRLGIELSGIYCSALPSELRGHCQALDKKSWSGDLDEIKISSFLKLKIIAPLLCMGLRP